MALIKCPDCAREVSDRAAACPSCAAPLAGSTSASPVAPPKPIAEERQFLNEGDVRVTTARFIVPAHTYAMSGVTSVGSSHTSPALGPLVAAILFTALFVMYGASSGSPTAWFMAVLCAAIAGALISFRKTKHHVVLKTAGGEVKALTSEDGTLITRIVKALNDAIVARG